MEAISSSKMSKHLTTTHRRPLFEYLFSSDGVINHYAENDIICSVMHSPILTRELQDQIVQSELYHQSLCSQAATSGFCILLYTLQLCCIKILIWTNFAILTNKEYHKIYRIHFETPDNKLEYKF